MFSFLTLSQNLPFSVALAVMLGIALLEGITTVLGAALSNALDSLLPDSWGIDLDADTPLDTPNALSRLLGWLHFGRVPVLMLLVVFLTCFGLFGLIIQSLTQGILGFLWPAPIASLIAILPSLPAVRLLGGALSRILPGDETEVVSEETLVGRVAVITIGQASRGRPAEARVQDQYGTTHYVMVEPDQPEARFGAGERVLLVRREASRFAVIAVDNSALTD